MRLSQPNTARRSTHAAKNRANVGQYQYTPYGQRIVMDASFSGAGSTSSYGQQRGFQGLLHDQESGLIENRRRMLDPLTGRFLQRDPLGYPDGMNAYAAYHVMWGGVDPMGLSTWEDVGEWENRSVRVFDRYTYGNPSGFELHLSPHAPEGERCFLAFTVDKLSVYRDDLWQEMQIRRSNPRYQNLDNQINQNDAQNDALQKQFDNLTIMINGANVAAGYYDSQGNASAARGLAFQVTATGLAGAAMFSGPFSGVFAAGAFTFGVLSWQAYAEADGYYGQAAAARQRMAGYQAEQAQVLQQQNQLLQRNTQLLRQMMNTPEYLYDVRKRNKRSVYTTIDEGFDAVNRRVPLDCSDCDTLLEQFPAGGVITPVPEWVIGKYGS